MPTYIPGGIKTNYDELIINNNGTEFSLAEEHIALKADVTKQKAGKGFAILDQNLDRRVSEYIAKRGSYIYVDRIITNFYNNIVETLCIRGQSLYKATDNSYSNTWSTGCTIGSLDLSTGLTVNVLSGSTNVKSATYTVSNVLRGIGNIRDKLEGTTVTRNIGIIDLSTITWTSGHQLYSVASNIILKIPVGVDVDNPQFMVQGIKPRVLSSESGVQYSSNYKCLILNLLVAGGELEGVAGATNLDKAKTWLAANPITVSYKKAVPTTESVSVSTDYYPFAFSGDMNITTSNVTFNPIIEAKVKVSRQELKDYILNKNGTKYNGQLKTVGIQLCNSKNKPIQLRGVGLHNLIYYSHLHGYKCIESLKYHGVSIIRLSAYLLRRPYIKTGDAAETYIDGYINDKSGHQYEMDRIISYCKDLGIYVLVDWHVLGENPILDTVNEAKEFFIYFAEKYPADPAILYELLNEPVGVITTDEDVSSFVSQCAPMITTYSPNAIMICGKRGVGSSVLALYSAIQTAISLPNLFMSYHWYVADYDSYTLDVATNTYIKNMIDPILESNIPLFISEWGNCEGSGDGARWDEAAIWTIKHLKIKGVSWAIWKLTDQDMTSAMLVHGEDEYLANGGWVYDDLSEGGKVIFPYFADETEDI